MTLSGVRCTHDWLRGLTERPAGPMVCRVSISEESGSVCVDGLTLMQAPVDSHVVIT